MPPAVLEIKLGRPLQMPAKRLEKLLEQARRDCCRARNAAIMHWYHWRVTHPEWTPGAPYDAPSPKRKLSPRVDRRKESAQYRRLVEEHATETNPKKRDRLAKKLAKYDEPMKPPTDSPVGPRLFLSRELYAAGCAAAIKLAANLASSCVQDVLSRLKSNTPYDHDGSARFVWQAILDHEVSVPTWRGGKIPMPSKETCIGYDGLVLPGKRPGAADVARAAESGAAIRFALLSMASGYATRSPIVRLEVGDLSLGRKRIFRKICTGEYKLSDSSLYEKKGKWFAQLCYEAPTEAAGLPEDRVLTIGPAQPDDRRPFVATWLDDEGHARRWYLGEGKPLVAEFRRVKARRRAIQYRYRDGMGSGHGRQRWARAIKPMSRAVVDMQSRFLKLLSSDVVKLAIREGCGTIHYREPTLPVRTKEWFATQDVPMDWTTLESKIAWKAKQKGLRYEKTRIGMNEYRVWCEEKEWKPEDESESAAAG